MTDRIFVLGTRKSKLALWQANHIGQSLQDIQPGFQFRLETFITTGDIKLDQPLPEIGGKGLFTQELEHALQTGAIDFVVHSLKDLPVDDTAGLSISSIPSRENPKDVLIAKQKCNLMNLPQGAKVGTSSLRRSAQLLHVRPDLVLLPLRGNIDTRIQKALHGEYDAIILAAAGVYRLGLQEFVQEELSMEIMLPAPGQGALAIQSRKNDKTLNSILSTIEDKNTRHAVIAERSFLKNLGGGCSAPIAAYATIRDDLLYMDGLVASVDGEKILRVNGSCKNTLDQASQLGMVLAGAILRRGAKKLMQMDKGAS
ncbi:MAG: hydroxymethylbilane synthase [Anaerolineaceae bacterium]|nr:hydroxymethylbilane synthase [Anaerolineaceae bacterium]